jgi:hypothetical protein
MEEEEEEEEKDDLTPRERVAKMLVDHFIDFQGCNPADHDHHRHCDEECIGMFEFIKARNEIFDEIPMLAEPDFAQDSRLPAEARNYENDDYMEDNWEKRLTNPLDHMTTGEWNRWSGKIEALFTGGEERKHLAIGKNDITFSRDGAKRDMAIGQAIIDIDSILAMFTDLSVINTVIAISIVSNPIRNLKGSIHLAHHGAPLHHIPHFHLGHFGHDPKFDLYVMLPALYDKTIKRSKGNQHNHVSEDIRADFMDKCFLPAVEGVIGHHDGQAWDFRYDVSKAKATAAGREGNRHDNRSSGFRQEIHVDLDPTYIGLVWRKCEQRLKKEIRRAGKLGAFKGFQFFINSKGYKHRMKADELSKLMMIYKEKVDFVRTSLTDRSKLTSIQLRSTFTGSIWMWVLWSRWMMNSKQTRLAIHGCGGSAA